MRTTTTVALMLSGLLLSGCPSDKEDKPVCGDGLCEKGKGETNYACGTDCPPTCGDGFCDTTHDEHCTLDCGSDTPPPRLKEFFYCGGTGPWTCESTDRYAACCVGTFLTCPAAYPYACPREGGCFTAPCASTYNYCVYYGTPCSTNGVAAKRSDMNSPESEAPIPGQGLPAPNFSEDVRP